jgi:hypothetical protein
MAWQIIRQRFRAPGLRSSAWARHFANLDRLGYRGFGRFGLFEHDFRLGSARCAAGEQRRQSQECEDAV